MEKVDTRTSILTAAEKLFAEQGYEGTSTRQIAREAGANMAMINYYFGSKDGVFTEIMTNSIKDFNMQLISINEDKVSSMEKLKKVVNRYVYRILNNIPFHRMMHREFLLAQRPEIFCRMKDAMAINLNMIEGIINEGIDNGSFKKIDVRMLIATITGTISNVAVFPSKITAGSKLDINIPEDRKILTERLIVYLNDLITTYLTPQK
ncbi:TetR/AcrR family transcriptional regulator [Pedobacter sp. HMWF019]|uniref:TetR/AcrR family transcriptional regulator n=1 Tax=Pedobacter sp. HMWF019 TaxID=2056856 RepID=UPI000D3924B5|nr:TetR/AcrR family transcriptional regulator [Pedobacter sp. HMWF019]PTT03234.1 TetR/AcrR family transcriptional regulator [Pedobacter sp. HMWF019]